MNEFLLSKSHKKNVKTETPHTLNGDSHTTGDEDSSEYECLVTLLKIGNCKKVSQFPGDLVARLDLERDIFSWEIFNHSSLQKVEIPISSIESAWLDNSIGNGVSMLMLSLKENPLTFEASHIPHQKPDWKNSKLTLEGDYPKTHIAYVRTEQIIEPLEILVNRIKQVQVYPPQPKKNCLETIFMEGDLINTF